jgi:uncharacterized pyridoxamine 5'-phosphate oxidase family protein
MTKLFKNAKAVQAIAYIEKSKHALLATVGEDNRPSVLKIGPFVNKGLDVYFVTRLDSQKSNTSA